MGKWKKIIMITQQDVKATFLNGKLIYKNTTFKFSKWDDYFALDC